MASTTIDVVWNGLTMSHEGPYKVGRISGWDELPAPRLDEVNRPNAHGAFDAPVWAGAKHVVVEGYCIDQNSRDALLTGLGATFSYGGDVALAPLQVTFAGRTLTSQARLLRFGTVLDMYGVGHFKWQAEWFCPDPQRYGPTLTASTGIGGGGTQGLAFPLFDVTGNLEFGALGTPGTVTVTNTGSSPAWPTFKVDGQVTGGFVLAELATGKVLRWDSDVPTGTSVVMNSLTGAVSFAGVAGYDGALTTRQWWPIPAGGSSTVQFSSLGSPNVGALLTVSWATAYWL